MGANYGSSLALYDKRELILSPIDLSPHLKIPQAAKKVYSNSSISSLVGGEKSVWNKNVIILESKNKHQPVANNQNISTSQGSKLSIRLSATDGDNDPLSFLVKTMPAHGTISGTAPNLTFTPTVGFAGVDRFTFQTNDGSQNSNLGTVTINVLPVYVDWTSSSQTSANESGTLTVTARLSAVTGQVVTIPFTVSGTAIGADRTISASPITIAAGATSSTATIRITEDSLIEGKETVILTMGTPINATKGTLTAHAAVITDDDVLPSGPISKDSIVGQRESGGAALGYYVNSNSSRVGTGGVVRTRADRNVVMGYRLPTLPVGVKVTSATFTFEITGGRDSANLDPGLDVYLLKTANPDTSGTAFFYHGVSANTSSAKLVGSKSISIGQNTVAYADDQYDVELTLTGEALALLKSFYGSDHVPDQPEAFFRFNLNKDPAVSSYIRYEIDLADSESALAINAVPVTATLKQDGSATTTGNASAQGVSQKGSSCGVGNGLAVFALLSFFFAATCLRRKVS
jgi:hypothetical protein